MKSRVVATLFVLTLVAGASAGRSIKWMGRPEGAFKAAKQSMQPIMFYVKGTSSDCCSETEDDQRKVLNDREIVELSNRFICAKLNARAHEDVLKKIGLTYSRSLSQSMVFVSPDGDILGRIGASGITETNSMVQKMEGVLTIYGGKVWDTLKEEFVNPKTDEKKLKEDLKIVVGLNIKQADEAVLKVLERKDLSSSFQRDAIDFLELVASDAAIVGLFQMCFSPDERFASTAEKAVKKADVPAAKLLLPFLEDRQMQAKAAEVIGKIARVRSVKKADWWESAKESDIRSEIDRIKEDVTRAVEKWEKKKARKERAMKKHFEKNRRGRRR